MSTPPKLAHDLRHALVHLVFVGDVHGNGDRLAGAFGRKLVGGRPRFIEIEIGNGDVGALRHVAPRDGFADALRAACNDGNFVLQLHNSVSAG